MNVDEIVDYYERVIREVCKRYMVVIYELYNDEPER
jgi:hypothetical protein